jgi:glucokinase-like ROK family protein
LKRTTRDLRKINRQILLQLIYFHTPTTRLELSELSGLSPATVTNVVTMLLNEGIVTELGAQESLGGRPRISLALNAEHGYFIGVDVGETYIHIELLDLTLQKVSFTRRVLAADEVQPEQIVNYLVPDIHSLLDQAQIREEKVLGIGIGMPGIVDQQAGVSVFAPNWGWHNVPLSQLLTEKLSVPIYVDNGAHVMALAERWFGPGRTVNDMAVLLLGTGVGASIITRGELYRGATNSAGEWGHMCIQLDGVLCPCGSRGCLEAYIGAPNIIRRFHDLEPPQSLLSRESQHDALAHLLQAAQAGEVTARLVLSDTTHYLGVGIANLINLFNPQMIVIGGWAGLLLGDYLLPRLHPVVERYALKQPAGIVDIQLSKMGQDSVSIGAASLALERFLKPAPAVLSVMR